MWGDNLPHAAGVRRFRRCLRLGSCLGVSIFVSTGCKACQIITDASLESISYSTNEGTLAEIYTYQSDKTRNRRKPWGLAATGEKCMQDDRWNEQEACEMGEACLCACVTRGSFVVYKSQVEVLSFDVSMKTPHRGWKSFWAHFCFSGRNADRLSRTVLNLSL